MTTDIKILRSLMKTKHDGNFYDVSKSFTSRTLKSKIDDFVVGLEKDGMVEKQVYGYLSESNIPPGGDLEDANNSICRITPDGINYYPNYKLNKRNYVFSIIALIISVIAASFTALTYFYN